MTDIVRHVAVFLLPASLVVALAILVKGYAHVGDGFSAGVVAALGVLVQYVGLGREEARARVRARHAPLALVLGLLLMLLVVVLPMLAGHSIVTHFPGPGSPVTSLGSLELHTAVLFDVGIFLVVLSVLVLILDHLIELRAEEA